MTLPELPLLKRELVGLLRTRKAFWIVVVSLFLSSVVPLLAWPSQAGVYRTGMENVWTFNLFFMTQLTTALFMIPAFTAGAIAGERERDTYDALYSTLLRPSTIVLSKILASAGFVVLVLVCSSPAVLVLYLLGGLGFESILKCYAVTLGAMVVSSLISLSHSMRSRKTAQAAVRGVFWVLFWNLGLLLLFYLGIGVWYSLARPVNVPPAVIKVFVELVVCISPYTPIAFEVLEPNRMTNSSLQRFGLADWVRPWNVYLIFAAALSLAHFLLLLRRARTPEFFVPTRRERKLARRGAQSRPVRRTAFAKALISRGDDGFPLIRNAVFLKELRSEFFSKLWFRRACFWLPLLMFTAIGITDMGAPERATVIACTAFTLLALLVPSVAASSFPREIEQGNLDFLRGTSLTLREILAGKFLASIYSCWGILAAASWIILGVILFSGEWPGNFFFSRWSDGGKSEHGPWIISISVLILATGLLFVAATATLASTLAKKTLTALLLAYGFILGVFLAWPILVSLIIRHWSDAEAILTATSPYVAIVQAVNHSAYAETGSIFGFFVVYGIAVLLLWRLSVLVLESKRARDP